MGNISVELLMNLRTEILTLKAKYIYFCLISSISLNRCEIGGMTTNTFLVIVFCFGLSW